MNSTTLLLAATSGTRWHWMPPAWVVWMLVVPACIALAWWAYKRDRDVPTRARLLLAGLRAAALLFFLLLVFRPYAEISETRVVRSHLVVLVDTSASMATVDGYDPEDARALAKASGASPAEVTQMSRLDVARRVLGNPGNGLLERFTEGFRFHVYGFGSHLVPLVSTGDTAQDEEPGAQAPHEKVRARLGELSATDPSTRIGQAVGLALDAYRLRDEAVAGVIVVSDGQQNGGSLTMLQAGRKAAAQHVPVYAVGVGDPRSPRNIHVGNLRAKEVVLARDTSVFEFEVHAKGFEKRLVPLELMRLDDSGKPTGSPLPINPSAVVLKGGDDAQQVRVTHQFLRAGTYSLRIGVPVQDEEKIKSDNFVQHTLRVIDRKIKVLYVEGLPRWEFSYLSNALTRDRETMLAHTLLLDADPDTPQRRTNSPDWEPLDSNRAVPVREELFEYDVVILGDVDWRDLAPTEEQAREAVENLREFVDKGGGLVFLAGSRHNPTKYKDTRLAAVLPIVIDRAAEREEEARPRDSREGFAFEVTPEGAQSPLMNLTGDPAESERLWENQPDWRQYWSYPALRAKALAKVLAVADDPRQDSSRGRRPLLATMIYGRGRTLYIGVDQLWRMRRYVGDKYFYRFYGEAVRFLATYKLLGGNKRFKIMTDLATYTLDDTVRITVDVLDRDYEPARAESQTVVLDMPGAEPGKRERVDLVIPVDPGEPGTYRKTIVPTRPGDYRLTATPDDPKDEPKDEPPEKIFHVVQSSLEGRDLLLDEPALRDLAGASADGEYLHLRDLPDLQPRSGEKQVPTDVREDDLWDTGWTLAIALALLAAEWTLRKRWHLV